MWTYIPRIVSNINWASREFGDYSSIQRVMQELRSRAVQYNVNYAGQVVVKCPTDSFDEFSTLGKTRDGKHDIYTILRAKNHSVYDKLAYISYDHLDELQEILNYLNMDETKLKKIVIYNKGSFMQ
jgi:hypothetical protein